ncbi:hypothetical protein [Bradyrhizobium sp.]|uniref:hypothetical protein n=1 Tax=Bradyrhizobium sp. TaxID=376 RepID=UPI002604ED7F|nr:hypothetical protein [Bradyrhizobium sp.]
MKSAAAKAREEIASHFQESEMAETDLDGVIRSIGKTQHKALMGEAKKRQARLMGLAAKAKTKESKARLKQTAKDMMLLAGAAARRLQITAENAADSYARAMRNALEELKAGETKALTAKKKAAEKKG